MPRQKTIADRKKKKLKLATSKSMLLRRGDMVQVIAGDDRGMVGKILQVLPRSQRVIVERVNFIKRHTRPKRQGQQGGILEKEAPIHISNVLLHDPKVDRGVRAGVERRSDGTIERISKKSGDTIGSA